MENTNEFNRVLVAGCACVITSLLTYEEIERYKRYHPEALTMLDDDGQDVFAIDTTDGPGCLLKDRAEYSCMKSADGKATITILLMPDIDDKEAAIREKICPCLPHLDELERQLLEKLGMLEEEENKAFGMVTFA
ncbi:MAG: hypothetical protein K6F61_06095 [Clostridiales bacterium]|nr:hypothetical protein [Clostridiales bacterium]